jgi:hypothetical protein
LHAVCIAAWRVACCVAAGTLRRQVRVDQTAVAHLLPAAIIDRDRFRFLRA